MQDFTMYVLADSTLGVVRDKHNARNVNAPTFTKGFGVRLHIRLFKEDNSTEPYPIEQLAGITSWRCALDVDYNKDTEPLLMAEANTINASTVIEQGEDETESTAYTELVIPLRNMNTPELVEWLGNAESKGGLVAEIIGFDENGEEAFGLQIKNFTILGRIYETKVANSDYEHVISRHIIPNLRDIGIVIEVSTDAVEWHDVEFWQSAKYMRFKETSTLWSPVLICV